MQPKKGFTLIEILIVVAIIAIITITIIFSVTNNLSRSRDTKRKADLKRIQIALEDYYADNFAYPTSDLMGTCDSSQLSPYLSNLPCDPQTKNPYCYIYDAEDPTGQSYRLLASLENETDPAIADLGCDSSPNYCGFESECSIFGNNYNFGVSSTNISVTNDGGIVSVGGGSIATPTPSPTPTPSLDPNNHYACGHNQVTGLGVCGFYSDPVSSNCGISFNLESACDSYCPTSPISVRCTN